MALTLATPIATARTILNDPDAVRYSAADLLQYANDALDVLSQPQLLPELFYTDGTHDCTADTVDQTLAFGTASALVKVNSVQGGSVVTMVDLAALDEFDPTWRSATSASAVNWGPKHGHPLKFMVYPPAPTGQTLEVTYVAVPPEHLVDADTGLPATLADAIADYIVGRAESRDATHVMSGRAAQFMTSFMLKVKGA